MKKCIYKFQKTKKPYKVYWKLNIFFIVFLIFFLTNSYTQSVHNRTTGSNYLSIISSISEANNGDLIEVDPGTYNEEIYIKGFTNLIIRATTWTQSGDNTSTIIDATGNNQGLYLNNAINNSIIGFTFKKANSSGIVLSGTSISNKICNNYFYSNSLCGINISFESVDNNLFQSNLFYGTGQTYGLDIGNGDFNIIRDNTIIKHIFAGIILQSSATFNEIINNIICSNKNAVDILSENTENNIIKSNTIYGPNQNPAIDIHGGDNNIIRNNNIYNNGAALRLTSGTSNTKIINNRICSNIINGITILGDSVDNTEIISNIISGFNQFRGIHISDSDNIKIYRNLIRNNDNDGIYIDGSTTNINIINNTITKNKGNGIFLNNNSSSIVLNNIILSNGDAGSESGIYLSDTASVYVDYNIIYGDFAGPTNKFAGGTFIWGENNILMNPIIDSYLTYTIVSITSPAIDNGTNVFSVSDIWIGNGPDIGWKESSFTLFSDVISNATKLSTPTNILCKIEGIYINIKWDEVRNAESYIIAQNSKENVIAILNTSDLNWTDKNVIVQDNQVIYYIKAANNVTESDWGEMRVEIDPFQGGKVRIAPTTVCNDDLLYFANVTKETILTLYDIRGRLLWQANVTDSSQCIPVVEFFYIKPELIENLANGHYIIVFKDGKKEPQIRKFNRVTKKR